MGSTSQRGEMINAGRLNKSHFTLKLGKNRSEDNASAGTSARFCTLRARFRSHALALLHIQLTRFGEQPSRDLACFFLPSSHSNQHHPSEL